MKETLLKFKEYYKKINNAKQLAKVEANLAKYERKESAPIEKDIKKK